MSFSGCGKRKPPLPPAERVEQRLEISGRQQGNKVIISWVMPVRNAGKGNILRIDRVDVYRLAEPLSSSGGVSEEDFASRGTLIDSVKVAIDDFGRKTMTYADVLTFAGQPVRLRYAVRLANDSGQKAGFSNFLVIEPSARVAAPPEDVAATVTQTEILVTWRSPASNVDGSSPANIVGYNLYRATAGASPALLNKEPVRANEFRDKTFDFGGEYAYLVRAVSTGGDGEQVESLDSAVVGVKPVDQFPPAAPAALTIAASPGAISLFFASNLEPDVVGYRIYRSEDAALPEVDWALLTPAGITTNTFQDAGVVPGRRYYYFVKAYDRFGNVSARSEIASDTVPN